MASTLHPYKRLAGSGGQLLVPAPYVYLVALVCPLILLLRNGVRLFQGVDHLLNVTSTGYTETYKRFYYQEIQAIVLRRTSEAAAWNAVWGTLMVIFLSFAAFSDAAPAQVTLGIVAGMFAICLGVNVALGPTCTCHLKTAVQIEPLHSLSRVRRARKTIARIKSLASSYQEPAPTSASAAPQAAAE